MADLVVGRDVRGSSLLQVPGEKRRTRSRSRSKTSTHRASRSTSPLPSLLKDDREKSPFEIGETRAMLKAAPKAVFDKALVMDISPSVAKKGDEEVVYITTDMSVIDKALVMDVSSVTLIVLEDEDEEDDVESVITEDEIHDDKSIDEELEGEGQKKEKKVKKVVKKKKKKAPAKEKKEKTPPLKLQIKEPKKNLKGMFDKPTIVEEPPKEKKPMSAKKLEKLKMIEQMKAEAAIKKAAEDDEKRRKEAEKERKLQEKQAKMKPQESQDSGLMAVLDKQRKKQEEAKRKAAAGIKDTDLFDESKKSKATNGDASDLRAGLRKVSIADSMISDSNASVESNGDSGDVDLNLRPIKHQSMDFGNGNDDEDGSDNDTGKSRSRAASKIDVQTLGKGGSDGESDAGSAAGSRAGSPAESEGGSEPPSDLSDDEEPIQKPKDFEKRQSMVDNPTDGITAELEKTFFVERKKSVWKPAKEEEKPQPESPKNEQVKTVSEKEKDAEFQKQREATRPPAIETFLMDRTVREYENLKLTCNVSGPDINIRWYKNGNIVEKSNRIKMKVSDGLLVLEIPKAEISDSGEYSCLIRNKNGEVSTKCVAKVYKEVFDHPVAPQFTTIRG